MPTLEVTPEGVQVHLSLTEKIASLSGDLDIPRDVIAAVEPVDDPLSAVRGFRMPGTHLPGLIRAGTWRGRGGTKFVAVRRGQPGIRLDLRNGKFDSVIVSTDDRDEALAQLEALSS